MADENTTNQADSIDFQLMDEQTLTQLYEELMVSQLPGLAKSVVPDGIVTLEERIAQANAGAEIDFNNRERAEGRPDFLTIDGELSTEEKQTLEGTTQGDALIAGFGTQAVPERTREQMLQALLAAETIEEPTPAVQPEAAPALAPTLNAELLNREGGTLPPDAENPLLAMLSRAAEEPSFTQPLSIPDVSEPEVVSASANEPEPSNAFSSEQLANMNSSAEDISALLRPDALNNEAVAAAIDALGNNDGRVDVAEMYALQALGVNDPAKLKEIADLLRSTGTVNAEQPSSPATETAALNPSYTPIDASLAGPENGRS